MPHNSRVHIDVVSTERLKALITAFRTKKIKKIVIVNFEAFVYLNNSKRMPAKDRKQTLTRENMQQSTVKKLAKNQCCSSYTNK